MSKTGTFYCILWFLIVGAMLFSASICVGMKSITGSFVGSIKETKEMLQFYKEKGLSSMIEVVKMDYEIGRAHV